jgi:DNA-binding HxlR family transcriptional regulator
MRQSGGPGSSGRASTGPGGRAIALIADGRLVWIMRELAAAAEGLQINHLSERTRTIEPSTLKSKLRLLARAGVVRREPRGARSSGVVQHLEPVGHALLALADGVFGWEIRMNPEALADMVHAGSPALRVLADHWTARLLVELSDSPRTLAGLERSLLGLTRGQLEWRLEHLVHARLARRRDDLFEVMPAGRKAATFLGCGTYVERRFGLPGAVAPTPADMASVLRITAPLVRFDAPPGWSCDLVIEPEDGEGERPASLRIAVGSGGAVEARSGSPDEARPGAVVLGTRAEWCAALVDGGGRGPGPRFRRETKASRAMVGELRRAFSLDG